MGSAGFIVLALPSIIFMTLDQIISLLQSTGSAFEKGVDEVHSPGFYEE